MTLRNFRQRTTLKPARRRLSRMHFDRPCCLLRHGSIRKFATGQRYSSASTSMRCVNTANGANACSGTLRRLSAVGDIQLICPINAFVLQQRGRRKAVPGYFFPFALASLTVPCYLKQRSGTRYPPAKAGAAWVDPLERAVPCEKLLRCRLGWELTQHWSSPLV